MTRRHEDNAVTIEVLKTQLAQAMAQEHMVSKTTADLDDPQPSIMSLTQDIQRIISAEQRILAQTLTSSFGSQMDQMTRRFQGIFDTIHQRKDQENRMWSRLEQHKWVGMGALSVIGAVLGSTITYVICSGFMSTQHHQDTAEKNQLALAGEAFRQIFPTLSKKDQDSMMRKMREILATHPQRPLENP